MAQGIPSFDEAGLLRSAAAGDMRAFELLLFSRHDRLRGQIDRHLPAKMRAVVDVDDVLQNVLMAAFEHLADFEPQQADSLDHWLAKIASNKVRDAVEHADAQARGGGWARLTEPTASDASSAILLLDLLAVDEHTPSRAVSRQDAVRAMCVAMTEIADDYSKVLQLRYIEQLSVAETARRMGRTEGAVEMLCVRAKAELRQVMGRVSQYLSSRE